MTTFVLRTEDERDLGFLLFAKHEGDWPPAGASDCVFSGFAFDPALRDDPRARFVADNKGEEQTCRISYGEKEMRVRIETGTGWVFELVSTADGNRWTARRGGETVAGTGMFL